MTSSQMTKLAVAHNLVTDFTHYLVVHDRVEAERADNLPETVRVRQMLAAGWGGAGSVECCQSISHLMQMADYDIPLSLRMSPRRDSSAVRFSKYLPAQAEYACGIPAFLRRDMDREKELENWLQVVAARLQTGGSIGETEFDLLLGLVAPEIAEVLKEVASLEGAEAAVRAFLAAYARSSLGDGLPRHLRRELRHLDHDDVERTALHLRLRVVLRHVASNVATQ